MLIPEPPRLHSYVVAFDSGFAPNPFYGFCTLATCKPKTRKSASKGDWVIGTGSADQKIGRGGYLVYAMRITETLSFDEYWADPRFEQKKPLRNGSKKQTCGDNIYSRAAVTAPWNQLDSFHSHPNGGQNTAHTTKDTHINRMLVSEEFAYFGGEGPLLPTANRIRQVVVHQGIGEHSVADQRVIEAFVEWFRSLDARGFVGKPHDWLIGRG